MELREPVERILRHKGPQVHSIRPDVTVFEALGQMAAHDVGALVVMDGSDLLGVISERDYARKVILKDRSSKQMQVHEIMSAPAITVTVKAGWESARGQL